MALELGVELGIGCVPGMGVCPRPGTGVCVDRVLARPFRYGLVSTEATILLNLTSLLCFGVLMVCSSCCIICVEGYISLLKLP